MSSIGTIAPRLGQLVRMLASDQDGEALNAARAIGRTLAGAKLDFHALAEFVESAPAPFVYKPATSPYRPAEPPSTASTKASREPQKPKAPSPWPTWSRLKHSQVVAWLHAVEDGPHSIDRNTRPAWDDLMRKFVQRPHEQVTTKEINLFNRLVRSTWEKGVRI